MEEMVSNDANFQKDDWELLFEFALDLIIFILMTYYWVFTCLNIFTGQQISNTTVEVKFAIPGVSTERQSALRVKPIFESKIGFLLEFYQYPIRSVT